MGNYRVYSEDEKAVALAFVEACGGDVPAAARHSGIPARTLRGWVKRKCGVGKGVEGKIPAVKKTLLDLISEKIDLLIGAVDQSRIDEASLVQITTAFGTLVDKSRLLRGEPTSINTDIARGMTVEELRDLDPADFARLYGEALRSP